MNLPLANAWGERTPRERAFLITAFVVVGVVLLWAFLWLPLEQRQAALERRIETQRTTLRQLDLATRLREAQRQEPAARIDRGDRSLASLVESGLRTAGLAAAIRRIEPLAEERLAVALAGRVDVRLVLSEEGRER